MLNMLLIIGMSIVSAAFILYTLAYYLECRSRILSYKVLGFFTAGVFFDFTATVFMILVSRNMSITPHGILGYTALMAMLGDVILLQLQRKRKGLNAEIPKNLHIYSTVAYFWWITAFSAGGLLVMLSGIK